MLKRYDFSLTKKWARTERVQWGVCAWPCSHIKNSHVKACCLKANSTAMTNRNCRSTTHSPARLQPKQTGNRTKIMTTTRNSCLQQYTKIMPGIFLSLLNFLFLFNTPGLNCKSTWRGDRPEGEFKVNFTKKLSEWSLNPCSKCWWKGQLKHSHPKGTCLLLS